MIRQLAAHGLAQKSSACLTTGQRVTTIVVEKILGDYDEHRVSAYR